MAQVIDFLAKKKELENKKGNKNQEVADNSFTPKEEERVSEKKEEDFNFEEIMKQNMSLKDKMSTERLKYNESVKRSYKLRPKKQEPK